MSQDAINPKILLLQGEVRSPSRYPSFPLSPRRVPVNLLPPPPLHYRSHYHHYHLPLPPPPQTITITNSLSHTHSSSLFLHPPSQSPFQPPAPNPAHRSPLTHAVRPVPVQARAPLASRRSATARLVFLFFSLSHPQRRIEPSGACRQSRPREPRVGRQRESPEETIGAIGCAGCAVVVSFVLAASLGELRWTIERASSGDVQRWTASGPFEKGSIPTAGHSGDVWSVSDWQHRL